MTEIKPTPEHLNDPYVLQLIEMLARVDDFIEDLRYSGNDSLADVIEDLLS